MRRIPKFVIVILSAFIIGCDQAHEVDYVVRNTSGEPISVFINHPGFRMDTNIIAESTWLIFINDFGLGLTTDEYLDMLKMLPVGMTIKNSQGADYNKDAEDLSNWDKYYPRKSQGKGMVQLTVRPEDFN